MTLLSVFIIAVLARCVLAPLTICVGRKQGASSALGLPLFFPSKIQATQEFVNIELDSVRTSPTPVTTLRGLDGAFGRAFSRYSSALLC